MCWVNTKRVQCYINLLTSTKVIKRWKALLEEVNIKWWFYKTEILCIQQFTLKYIKLELKNCKKNLKNTCYWGIWQCRILKCYHFKINITLGCSGKEDICFGRNKLTFLSTQVREFTTAWGLLYENVCSLLSSTGNCTDTDIPKCVHPHTHIPPTCTHRCKMKN